LRIRSTVSSTYNIGVQPPRTQRELDGRPVTEMPAAGSRLGRSYWKLFGAITLSNAADGIRLVAFPWLAATLTRDPLMVAGVAAAGQLPWLVVSVHAGVIIDRVNRRVLIVASQLVHLGIGVLLTLLVLSGDITVAALLSLAALTGCAEVVYDTTAQTVLPSLVPRSQVTRASGYLVGAEVSTQTMIGRPLGGLLAGLGVATAFLAQAVLALGAAVALLLIPAGTFRRSRPTPASITEDLRDGLRWLWAHRLLRDVGIVVAVSNVAYGATIAVFVLFAQEMLGVGALGFAVLGGCLAGGGVLGSVAAGSIAARLGERGTFLLVILATAAAFATIGISSNAVLVGSMLALIAAGFTIWEAVWRGMRIRFVPDHLLGRVTSLLRWLEMGPFPLASLLGGALVALGSAVVDRDLGLRLPYLVTAVVFVILAVVLYPLAGPQRFRTAEAAVSSNTAAT
jgi:MFS family permease